MTLHQVLAAAAPHDAVTNHALALRAALRALGPSEIYARYVDPAMAAEVHSLDGLSGAPARPSLVVHASIGDPDVADFLASRPEALIVVYHNVTPPEFYDAYDPPMADLLRLGRVELAALKGRTLLALGVSEFNAAELRTMGFGDVGVSPLSIGLDRLAKADPETLTALERHDGPVYLSVGQLLPHKRPDFLVRAMHVLSTYLAPEALLLFAGPARVPAYARAVRQFAAELALTNIRFLGAVSDQVLAALYRAADVCVTASEHEGFCAPLVEAMATDTPVVARRFGAVPETLAGAGVVLEPDDGPTVFAEAMGAATDRWRDRLVEAGRRRVAAVTAVDPARAFLDHVQRVIA